MKNKIYIIDGKTYLSHINDEVHLYPCTDDDTSRIRIMFDCFNRFADLVDTAAFVVRP